jgi:hypothetical protein
LVPVACWARCFSAAKPPRIAQKVAVSDFFLAAFIGTQLREVSGDDERRLLARAPYFVGLFRIFGIPVNNQPKPL